MSRSNSDKPAFNVFSKRQFLEVFRDRNRLLRPAILTYLNIHVLFVASRKNALMEALGQSHFTYCDSDGIRLLAKVRHGRYIEKVSAAHIHRHLFGLLARDKARIFLLGGSRNTVAAASSYINQNYPGIQLVGAESGFFESDRSSELVVRINLSRPDILIAGLGTPRQEIWLVENMSRLEVPLAWCVGSFLEYLAGKQKRAPRWMLKRNLEWLHRFFQRPFSHFSRVFLEIPWVFLQVCKGEKLFCFSSIHSKVPPKTNQFKMG